MNTKRTIVLVTMVILILGAVNVYAGAYARWVGKTIAATQAAAFVPGAVPPGCRQTNVYPFNATSLPVTSYCLLFRNPPSAGGAWGWAYCDTTVTGTRLAWAWSGAWGFFAFGGKAMGDTTQCSTAVEITYDVSTFDLSVYARLESFDPLQTSTILLEATAEGETLFQGMAHFRGDPDSLETSGSFDSGDFIVLDGIATMERLYTGIDLNGHPPESLIVQATTDAVPNYPVPATNQYGLIILLVLLLAIGIFLIYRRKSRAKAASA